MMTTFIALLFSALAAFAAPEACSTVDLTAANEPLAGVPRWSQGHSNLCYAYSASTLIDAYRFQKGDKDLKHLTSPLLLAARTIEKYGSIGSTLAGGKVEHAFASARTFGSCDVKTVSDKLGGYTTDAILNMLTESYKQSKTPNALRAKVADQVVKFIESAGVKMDRMPSSEEVQKNLDLDRDEFIAETLLKFCGDVKKMDELPTPKLFFRPRASQDELLERLQDLLSARIPVGVNFCANVLNEPDHKGYMSKGDWVCKEKLNHSAIIAGRMIKDGQCQFLIQDTGCDGFKKKTPNGCIDGHYWIPSDKMMANTHGLFWLE